MIITLRPKQIVRLLLGITLALTLINGIALIIYFRWDSPIAHIVTGVFDFDTEETIPTVFSAILLFLCSAALAIHAKRSRCDSDGRFFYWASLSAIFCFLAFDEACRIHENLSDLFETFMEARGVLYFLWVIPYGIATAALGLFYLPLVWKLPQPIRKRFIIAGLIFLTGALGVEMLGAREADTHGVETVAYCALYTVEEFLEMLGTILFFSALLTHLGRFTLNLGSPSTAGEP